MERRKVYVDVDVSILKNGKVYPRRFRYEDGTVFQVERLIDTCKAQSTRCEDHRWCPGSSRKII